MLPRLDVGDPVSHPVQYATELILCAMAAVDAFFFCSSVDSASSGIVEVEGLARADDSILELVSWLGISSTTSTLAMAAFPSSSWRASSPIAASFGSWGKECGVSVVASSSSVVRRGGQCGGVMSGAWALLA